MIACGLRLCGVLVGAGLVVGVAIANPIPLEPGPGGPEQRGPGIVMPSERIRISIHREGESYRAWVDCEYFMSTQVPHSPSGSQAYLSCPVPRDADCLDLRVLIPPLEWLPKLSRIPGVHKTSVGNYDVILWPALPETHRGASQDRIVEFVVRLRYRQAILNIGDTMVLVYPLGRSLQAAQLDPTNPVALILVTIEAGSSDLQVTTSVGAVPQRTVEVDGLTFVEATWQPTQATPLRDELRVEFRPSPTPVELMDLDQSGTISEGEWETALGLWRARVPIPGTEATVVGDADIRAILEAYAAQTPFVLHPHQARDRALELYLTANPAQRTSLLPVECSAWRISFEAGPAGGVVSYTNDLLTITVECSVVPYSDYKVRIFDKAGVLLWEGKVRTSGEVVPGERQVS